MRVHVADQAPSNWSVRSIDSLCTRVTSGGTPSRRISDYYGGDIPWIKTKELEDGWINGTEEAISESGLANSSAKVLPPNTVLMAMYGATVGKLALLARPMACNQAACALIVDNQRADYRYIFYQLLNARTQITDLANGAAQQNLSAGTIKALLIPVPPIDEQRGIAAALGALDDKIESNRSAIGIAGHLLDALGVALADTLASVPLASLIKVKRVAVDPTSLGDAQVDHYSLPAFDEGARPERVAASTIMSGKLAVTKPSILVSRLNPRFNRTWWAVPTEGVPALASTEFACITTGTREELAAVWLAVRDEYFRGEVVRRASGTSGSHQRVRPEDLLAIDVPDVRELSPYAQVEALALLDLIHGHRTESVKLAQLRDALLPELLSGRIRVPECREAVEEAVG